MKRYVYCTKKNCVGRVGTVCQWNTCPFGGAVVPTAAQIRLMHVKPLKIEEEEKPAKRKYTRKAPVVSWGKTVGETEVGEKIIKLIAEGGGWNEIVAVAGCGPSGVRMWLHAKYGTTSIQKIKERLECKQNNSTKS